VVGISGSKEVEALLRRNTFCKPCTINKLDGRPRWSLSAVVKWMARHRPTAELEQALIVLKKAEARLVPSRT
jgi:hypothetical protein